MTPETQQQIIQRIDALAAKLGVAGQALWKILLHEAILEGIESLFWGFVLLIGALYLSRWTKRLFVYCKDEDSDFWVGFGLLTAVNLIIGIVSLPFFSQAYESLLNPQFQAFKFLWEK